MGAINSKGKSKITVKTSEDGVLLSPGLHYDNEARVDKLVLKHLGKTKEEIILPIVEELFLCSSYGEVLSRAEHVAKRLEDLECFEKVNISIDSSKGPDATAHGLEVTLQVEEVPWIQLGLTCLDGNEDNNGGLTVQMPNVFGQAEKAKMSWTYSLPSGLNNYFLQLTKPVAVRGNSVVNVDAYQRNSLEGKSAVQVFDATVPDSAYLLETRGFNAGVSFDSFSNVRHSVTYKIQWRTQTCKGNEVPVVLQDQCGYSTKSSLVHKLDWQNCKQHAPALPAHGSKVSMTNEFAGMGGDIAFFKHEIQAERAVPLLKNVTGQAVGQVGSMSATEGTFMLTPDKFFLGGPASVRGFERRGIKSDSDTQSLGSDIYYAGGLHLYYRVPSERFTKRFGENLRLHGFTNFGSIGNLSQAADSITAIGTLLRTTRIACGLGLSVRLGEQARMELNYCFPMSSQSSDVTRAGMQFGIGFNFL